MALLITEECISCGACLPECPNEAIFETRSDAEAKGNQRRRPCSGRNSLCDSADQEDAEEERDAARQHPHSPEVRIGLEVPLLPVRQAHRFGRRHREERHARRLVGVVVAAVDGAVDGVARAVVDLQLACDDRTCQAEMRQVLRRDAS